MTKLVTFPVTIGHDVFIDEHIAPEAMTTEPEVGQTVWFATIDEPEVRSIEWGDPQGKGELDELYKNWLKAGLLYKNKEDCEARVKAMWEATTPKGL